MKILGIETSCDETALSLLDIEESKNSNTPKIETLSSELYSQVDIHKEYGGVFPTLAKREHSKNLVPLLIKLLSKTDIEFLGAETLENNESRFNLSENQIKTLNEIFEREPELLESFLKYIPKINRPDIDLISVTYGPGLEPALWVGINFARALSYIWDIPVIGANHMEGHIVSVLKNVERKLDFPTIALLISGGHTELVLVRDWGDYEIIGQTLDDAAGEAFDKVARLLDLPYPGGPEISKLAEQARGEKIKNNDINESGKNHTDQNLEKITLPRPMLKTDNYHFSFSGLKTAVLYLVKKIKETEKELSPEIKKEIALEFENAVTEVLLHKTKKAIQNFQAVNLIIGGGVIANKHIRETFKNQLDLNVMIPEIDLATDNAVMIAIAGYFKSKREEPKIFPIIKAEGNLAF